MSLIQPDPWSSLKSFTSARIALGRTGTAIPLKEVLSFKLAHAYARDAVYSRLDTLSLQEQLQPFHLPILLLHSKAADRHEYLQRPDKGRQLDPTTNPNSTYTAEKPVDVTFILADGLSATAINVHAVPLLQSLIPLFKSSGISIGPLCLVEQGRVAIGDEIGALLNTKLTIVLIGERPGLSAADSMGAYITFNPRPGTTDESRNCISNIRHEGLSYETAANKIFYLTQEALKLKLSGVNLKDNYYALT
jgi:ethanolamine ammonia-lyase small subunit